MAEVPSLFPPQNPESFHSLQALEALQALQATFQARSPISEHGTDYDFETADLRRKLFWAAYRCMFDVGVSSERGSAKNVAYQVLCIHMDWILDDCEADANEEAEAEADTDDEDEDEESDKENNPHFA